MDVHGNHIIIPNPLKRRERRIFGQLSPVYLFSTRSFCVQHLRVCVFIGRLNLLTNTGCG